MASLEDQIDPMIADLYRAAAGVSTWTQPLSQMVERLRCWGVQLLGLRRADGALAFSHDAGFPAEALLHYVSDYHRIDPRTPMLDRMALGEWWHCQEHFDEDFVARHPLYQELIIPFGGRYSSGAKLYQDEEVLVVMGVHRGRAEGPLAGDDLIAMHRLGFHAQHAIEIWRRHRRTRQQALAGEAIVSRLSQPVVLVDGGLRIHHRNAAAVDQLAHGGSVREREGRLVCAAAAAQADLLQAIDRLGLGEGGRLPDAMQPRRIVVRAGQSPGGVLLMLSALQPHETMGAFGPERIAMVLLHDLTRRRAPDPLLVSIAYSLTPAEGQVACSVAAGLSPVRIAECHGTSVHTVRAQLATVFEKVGVRRQAELAAALAGLNGL